MARERHRLLAALVEFTPALVLVDKLEFYTTAAMVLLAPVPILAVLAQVEQVTTEAVVAVLVAVLKPLAAVEVLELLLGQSRFKTPPDKFMALAPHFLLAM